jgi:DNA-binding NarL/FixJ family response regulator
MHHPGAAIAENQLGRVAGLAADGESAWPGIGVSRSGWPRPDSSGATGAHMNDPVPIKVNALDPISEFGVLAQLRHRPEVAIAGAGVRPAVVLAILDSTDDEALRWLKSLHADGGLPIVLIIGRVDPSALVCLVESGVCGVLHRVDATPERLIRAIQLASAGHGDLPPVLVRHLLDHVGQLNRNLLAPRGLSFAGLSGRERDVLRLIADGMSTREIATRLAYSERTIKNVIQELTLRLNVRNRTQAVACAVRNGWI